MPPPLVPCDCLTDCLTACLCTSIGWLSFPPAALPLGDGQKVDHGGRGGDGGGGGGGAGGRGGGFTPPPASPRAGTMRAGPSGSFAGASGGQNVERGGQTNTLPFFGRHRRESRR